jgi:glycosyltransferase involved in cell wall biosynthesis
LERGADFLVVADGAGAFAAGVVKLLADGGKARELAARARREVEQYWDLRVLTERLEGHYRDTLRFKRNGREGAKTDAMVVAS